MDTQSVTLWSNVEKGQYFLIPDGVTIESGDLLLRTVSGRQMAANEEAVKRFIVPRQEAKDWLKREVRNVVGQAARGVAATLSRKAPDSKPISSRLHDDPAKLIEALGSAIDDFGAVMRKARTGSDDDLSEAKNRMKRLRQTLDRHGIRLSEASNSLPDKLAQFARRAAEEARATEGETKDASDMHERRENC